MEKIRQDTSPNALRGIEICESRVNIGLLKINSIQKCESRVMAFYQQIDQSTLRKNQNAVGTNTDLA
jgi:hypothetical protein